MEWTIIVKPETSLVPARDPEPGAETVEGVNQSGLVIYLVGPNGTREEVTRVGYARRHTKNPKATFDDQLEAELKKARKVAATLSDAVSTAGELQ